ncbi:MULTISPECIES: DotU family type VI secretion system protein [Pelistega]|nr:MULTISPECIES: DotU family type VI secretion system protein [Pelistega]
MSSSDYMDSKMGVWNQVAMPDSAQQVELRPDDYVISGSNPLVAAANSLLTLLPQIRHSKEHENIDLLRDRLIDEIRQFELRAQAMGINNETILGARYCLCTALDEACALTPWGMNGQWSGKSLLVTFHNETWGGEKFFQLLAKLSQNAPAHLNFLELMYYCLMLGFEGRYRVIDNGRSQLETLKQRLLLLLNNTRGKYPQKLSLNWQAEEIVNQLKRLPISLWVVALAALMAGILLYWGFSWSLGDKSDALFRDIVKIQPPQLVEKKAIVSQAPVPDRLANFLASEIREDLLVVRDEADRSVVILRGDGLFESGSNQIRQQYLPVLSRVADALNGVEGNILVSGYSDNVPIKTLRFPSNWELSQARADAVKQLLEVRLNNKNRVRAEGKGEANPVAPNDTAENRAKNRRVEITLLVSPVK